MLTFIADNIANIAIALILAGIFALIIRKLVKDKKAGKACSSCSGCSHCESCDTK